MFIVECCSQTILRRCSCSSGSTLLNPSMDYCRILKPDHIAQVRLLILIYTVLKSFYGLLSNIENQIILCRCSCSSGYTLFLYPSMVYCRILKPDHNAQVLLLIWFYTVLKSFYGLLSNIEARSYCAGALAHLVIHCS